MAARKKSIKNASSNRRIRCRRITAHPATNAEKQARLVDHFEAVKSLKNRMSAHVYKHRHLLLDSEGSYALQSQHYKQFATTFLSAWETQQLFQGIVDAYQNSLNRLRLNRPFVVQVGVSLNLYTRDVSSRTGKLLHAKGSLRSYAIKTGSSPLASLLNWLSGFSLDRIDTVTRSVQIKPSDKQDSAAYLRRLASAREFNAELQRLRADPLKWQRIRQVLTHRQQALMRRLSLQILHSGSYRKAVRESGKNGALCSYVYQDSSNTLYQTWFRFRIRKQHIDVPLAVNRRYHDLSTLKSEANLIVSLNRKGRLQIGLACEVEQSLIRTVTTEQIVGIDLNVKDNFCVVGYHDRTQSYDYDREFLKSQFDKLRTFDEKGYQSLSETERRLLRKVREQTESYFRYQIGAILDDLQARQVSEIVLEDLNLAKTAGRGNPANETFGVRYSRLVRWLRLGQIKHWFRQQGNNRGLRVHFTPASYTSQECAECHWIERSNRSGQQFCCQQCNHQTHADHNASRNIRARAVEDVLRQQLHQEDRENQLTSRRLRKETVRQIVDACYVKRERSLNGRSAA